MACFCCNATKNFIFSLMYHQQKFDLNTNKKSLVFVMIRHKKFYLYVQLIIYKNFIFTQKYAFAERCCFLTFSFEGKLRKYDISVKQKHTKTYENTIFSALFANFRKTKVLFFHAVDAVFNFFALPLSYRFCCFRFCYQAINLSNSQLALCMPLKYCSLKFSYMCVS